MPQTFTTTTTAAPLPEGGVFAARFGRGRPRGAAEGGEHGRGWAALLLAPFFVVGCGATEDQLRSRAAFDMRCNQDQLRVVTIDNRTKGVEGCGQRATYVEQCNDPVNGTGCTWVMNNGRVNSATP